MRLLDRLYKISDIITNGIIIENLGTIGFYIKGSDLISKNKERFFTNVLLQSFVNSRIEYNTSTDFLRVGLRGKDHYFEIKIEELKEQDESYLVLKYGKMLVEGIRC